MIPLEFTLHSTYVHLNSRISELWMGNKKFCKILQNNNFKLNHGTYNVSLAYPSSSLDGLLIVLLKDNEIKAYIQIGNDLSYIVDSPNICVGCTNINDTLKGSITAYKLLRRKIKQALQLNREITIKL